MKIALNVFILFALLAAFACREKSTEAHDHGNDTLANMDNQALYDQVMQIHNEVMPKMNDLYKAKISLKAKISSNPAMEEKEKKDITAKIEKLDSAGESMMIWMRQFSPIPDSLGEEKARDYLQSEMTKVQRVKENIESALREVH
jgi:regulator of replication initiation timing